MIEELKDAICLAVSLVTGPMIRETVQIAREVKRLYPTMPIVLGGWHPSLLPDQTLAAEYVDVVVVGQGEEALLEVVQRMEAGESLKGIPGRRLQGGWQDSLQCRAPVAPVAGNAAQGLSSGRFRRL